jgi:hypothetical protein
MMTIKTWKEMEQEDGEPWRLPEACYMQDEIDELRAHCKSLEDQRETSREWKESATFAVDALKAEHKHELADLQAKLDAWERQGAVAGMLENRKVSIGAPDPRDIEYGWESLYTKPKEQS